MEDIMTSQVPYYFTDIKTIINYCSINKGLCSNRTFWINIFNQWGLDLPAALPVNINDWINELYAIYNTKKIITYLSLPQNDVILLNNKNLRTNNYYFKNINQNTNYFKELLELCQIQDFQRLKSTYNIMGINVGYYNVGFFSGRYAITFNVDGPFSFKTVSLSHTKNKNKEELFLVTKQQITLFLYNILRDRAV